MVDVVKLALERRAKLTEEIKRLDDFVKTAEALIRQTQNQPMTEKPAENAVPEVAIPVRPSTVSDQGKRAERMLQSMNEKSATPQNRPQVIRAQKAAAS